jgi:hypothetical protein
VTPPETRPSLATIAPRLAAARDAHEAEVKRLAGVRPEWHDLADRKGLLSLEDAARQIGIEFRTVDGDPRHPFHCGEHMTTTSFVTVDSATCRTCGAAIRDMTSVFQTGGLVLTDEVLAALGDRIWLADLGGDDGE